MDLGQFANSFVRDSSIFWVTTVAGCLLLAAFGVLYNALMTRLGEHKNKLVAIFVALGVGITVTMAASISWKASALILVYFIFSGVPMIIGDITRSIKAIEQPARSTPRRKPLPYAAAGLLDAATMANAQALHHLTAIIEKKPADMVGMIALAIVELSKANSALAEAKLIQPD